MAINVVRIFKFWWFTFRSKFLSKLENFIQKNPGYVKPMICLDYIFVSKASYALVEKTWLTYQFFWLLVSQVLIWFFSTNSWLTAGVVYLKVSITSPIIVSNAFGILNLNWQVRMCCEVLFVSGYEILWLYNSYSLSFSNKYQKPKKILYCIIIEHHN